MTQHSTSRRSLLTAALAVPVAAVGVPLVTAAPAGAVDPVDGCQTVVPWTAIVPIPDSGVTPDPSSPLQARVIRLAGTEFLQLRGLLTCTFTGESPIGTLPGTIRPPKLTRGTATRNNNQGINAIRVEANTAGLIKVHGPQPSNPVTWVQLDSFSAVMR
ncbi:hypothetical protein [Streptomyces lateritius]|uniref:hypothetical protein n=1 Tax=Streptomyces lateritius TaxID=67313 RepID=UPI00167A6ADF|nr:hypothetical protein [Streptomyces lateritius]GGT93679.1 hypothetical protein GCM10010272_43250 [Streptomyces lateritius]